MMDNPTVDQIQFLAEQLLEFEGQLRRYETEVEFEILMIWLRQIRIALEFLA